MKTPRELLLEQHRTAEEKLKSIQASDLAACARESLQTSKTSETSPFSLPAIAANFWNEAIVPWRRAWLGMVAIWIGILALNFSMSDGSRVTDRISVAQADPQVRMALLEQKKMLAQLLEPMTLPPQKVFRPANNGPRSDMKIEEAMV